MLRRSLCLRSDRVDVEKRTAMPRPPRSPLLPYLLPCVALLAASPGPARARDSTVDSLSPRREWTVSAGLASGYGYGAEPRPVPADLRHLKPTSTFALGVWRQRASGRGLGVRVDGMQYNDHHATRDLYGTPISVRRRATVLAASALVRWRSAPEHGMGFQAGAGPTVVFVDWRYDADASGTPELSGQTAFVTAGLRGEIGLARRSADGWIGAVEFGGLVTLRAGNGAVVGDPSGLEPLHLGQAVLTVGHTF